MVRQSMTVESQPNGVLKHYKYFIVNLLIETNNFFYEKEGHGKVVKIYFNSIILRIFIITICLQFKI